MIMTMTLMAFLIGGGFSVAAHAQDSKDGAKSTNKSASVKVEDWDKVLKEYEKAVDQYVKAYKESTKGVKKPGVGDYQKYLKKVQELSSKIEAAKEKLTKEQLEYYMRINEKLKDVPIK